MPPRDIVVVRIVVWNIAIRVDWMLEISMSFGESFTDFLSDYFWPVYINGNRKDQFFPSSVRLVSLIRASPDGNSLKPD